MMPKLLYYYVLYTWCLQRIKYINNINKCKKEEKLHQLLFIMKRLINSIMSIKVQLGTSRKFLSENINYYPK